MTHLRRVRNDAWEKVSQASPSFSDGFNTGCEDLFNESPNGSLYEDDTEYTVMDCTNDEPDASGGSDVPADVPDDPQQAGEDLGELDGCQSLFENEGVVSLNYGTDSYTEDDCPTSAPAVAPPTKPSPKPGTKGAGDTCVGKKGDGTPIAMQIEKGQIACAGAQALVQEWLRRAPGEASGSSGALTLNGWTCAGATATEAPRVGTCERSDKTSQFTIFDGE